VVPQDAAVTCVETWSDRDTYTIFFFGRFVYHDVGVQFTRNTSIEQGFSGLRLCFNQPQEGEVGLGTLHFGNELKLAKTNLPHPIVTIFNMFCVTPTIPTRMRVAGSMLETKGAPSSQILPTITAVGRPAVFSSSACQCFFLEDCCFEFDAEQVCGRGDVDDVRGIAATHFVSDGKHGPAGASCTSHTSLMTLPGL
jgi:hypothetical protein